MGKWEGEKTGKSAMSFADTQSWKCDREGEAPAEPLTFIHSAFICVSSVAKSFFCLFFGILLLLFCAVNLECQEYYVFSGSWRSGFSWPQDVAAIGSGDIYVVDTGNHRIRKFSSNGTLLKDWGAYGSGDGELNNPGGISVDSSGDVYVADTWNDRIQKFSSNGDFLGKWGMPGDGDGEFNYPRDVAVDESGNVYVADTWNYRVQKFAGDGVFLAEWGTRGDGDGQFLAPSGIAVDSQGYVYVADTGNHRIQKFSSDGDFLAQWHSQFSWPEGIEVDNSGRIYVADTYNHSIQKFTLDGDLLAKWGMPGCGETGACYTVGVAVDAAGNVYEADDANHCIRVYRPATADDMVIELGAGWNLMSLPLQPGDNSIGSALSSIQGEYESIWTYEGNSGWLWYNPDMQDMSSLREVEAGVGYWIHMRQPWPLIVQGEKPLTVIWLRRGWNLAGYSLQSPRAIQDCMFSIGDKYSSVWGFDPEQGWTWYLPDAPEASNLWFMIPGRGYWINARWNCVWDVSINPP